MDTVQHSRIADFIWSIADDVLRDVYVRGKYRDVILPMTVVRRLDSTPGLFDDVRNTRMPKVESRAW